MTSPDGGRFRLTRLGDPAGQPVVLAPGMFDNRRVFLTAEGTGLAAALADAGFDVWVSERRGTGGVALVPGVRSGWAEAVRYDLPTTQRVVTAATGRGAFWLAHSFGGVALARALDGHVERDRVDGVILIASALEVPLLRSRLVATLLRNRRWKTVIPTRRMGLGTEDDPRESLADAVEWCADARGRRGAVRDDARYPVLALTGPRDRIAPARRCAEFAGTLGSADTRVQSAARRTGFRRDHGHETMLLRRDAATDVFPFIRDWLLVRTAGRSPSVTPPRPTGQRRHIRLGEFVPQPPAVVFAVLTERWGELWPMSQRRVRDSVSPVNLDGLQSVRAPRVLGVWPLHEVITVHDEEAGVIEYRTVRGPVRRHVGRITLSPLRDGTRLDYEMRFDTARWLPGALVVAVLVRTWSRWSVPRLLAAARGFDDRT
ncbi:serine aminopeptidase domain-containing protein [Nocardia sp. IFM 10818]